MQGFSRRKGQLVAHFEPQEVEILGSLLEQLVELLGDQCLGPWPCAPAGDEQEDVFARLEAELSSDSAEDIELDREVDPVLRRLFPDAYPDDPAASYDFRRFTQADQREAKIEGCCRMGDDLRAARQGRVSLTPERVDAWLSTLTNLRLALAVRLEIDDAEAVERLSELPENDPRSWLFSIFEWLGWVQESMLGCLEED